MLSKILAFILSFFFVGLGQVFLGKTNHGLRLCLLCYFGFPLFLLLSINVGFRAFTFAFIFTLVALPVLWAYNLFSILRIKPQ